MRINKQNITFYIISVFVGMIITIISISSLFTGIKGVIHRTAPWKLNVYNEIELGVISNRSTENFTALILFWRHSYIRTKHIDYERLECGNIQHHMNIQHNIPNCFVTSNKSRQSYADAVFFDVLGANFTDLPITKWNTKQRWILKSNESPVSWPMQRAMQHKHVINELFIWTSTYRRTATDFPAFEFYYSGTMPYKSDQDKSNLLKVKSKLALWMVSNCRVIERKQLVKELSKYIQIDIIGKCGEKADPCKKERTCVRQLMAQYKFYLALENSRCNEYITEKFWRPLLDGSVPIALGAPLSDYLQVAPPNSFLHVSNFSSVEKLAEYIMYLNMNEDAYMKYHEWRKYYIIHRNLNSAACQVCNRLYEEHTGKIKMENSVNEVLDAVWSPDVSCDKQLLPILTVDASLKQRWSSYVSRKWSKLNNNSFIQALYGIGPSFNMGHRTQGY